VVSILSSFCLSSLLGLVLLDLKVFDTDLLAGMVFAASLMIGAARRKALFRGAPSSGSPGIGGAEGLLLAVLLVTAAIFYFQPADTALLSSDATIYFTAGVQIAKTGTLAFNEELVRRIPDRLKEKFFRVRGQTSDYHRFPGGFILQDPARGKTVVSFQPLFPLWTAIFVSLFGLKGGFYLSPLLGVLSCLVFYLLAAKMLRQAWFPLFALAIMAFSPVQLWFARYTMPEIMLQFLILAGLYMRFFYEERDTFSGFLSAVLFGTALAAKFHAFIIVLFIILFCFVSILRGKEKKDEPYFFIPLAGLVFLNILHLFLYPNDYPPHLIIFLRQVFSGKGSFSTLLSLALLLALAAALIILRKRLAGFAGRLRRGLPAFLAVLGIYGLWVAPYAWNPLRLIPGFEVTYNSGNFARLAWYITPAGVALALMGCLILLGKDREMRREMKFFLWLALSYSLFFLFKGDAISQHYWNARKYVPFILPVCAIFMAVSLDWLRSLLGRRRYAGMCIVLFALFLAGSLLYSGRSLFMHREGDGAIDQIERLGHQFGDRPFILVQSKAEGWLLAQALTYLIDKPAVALPDRMFSEFDLHALHRWAEALDRSLYYLAPDSSAPTDKISHALNRFTPRGEFKFRIPVMERASTHRPSRKVSLALSLGVYSLTRPGAPAEAVFIDLGSNDFAYAARGFYAPERIEKKLSRHTDGHGTVTVPPQPPGDYILSASLTGGPLPEDRRNVRVYYNYRPARQFSVRDFFETYHIPVKIPAADSAYFHDSMELPVRDTRDARWRIYPKNDDIQLDIARDDFVEGLGALRVSSALRQRNTMLLGRLIPVEGGSRVTARIKIRTKRCSRAGLMISFFDAEGNRLGALPAGPSEKISRRGWFTSSCSGRAPAEAAFLRPKLRILGMRPPDAEARFDYFTIETDGASAAPLDTRIDFISFTRRPGGGDDRLLGLGVDWLKIKRRKGHHTPVSSLGGRREDAAP
jgi:hypothetical protein